MGKQIYYEKRGFFDGFFKRMTNEECILFFEKYFRDIENTVMKNLHFSYQRKVFSAFEDFFYKNNSKVEIKIWDFSNDELWAEPEKRFSTKEMTGLKRIFSSLTGHEIIYRKVFEVADFEDLKLLLKFQMRSEKVISFCFEKLKLTIHGSYEYAFITSGKYNEDKIAEILLSHKLYYRHLKPEEI